MQAFCGPKSSFRALWALLSYILGPKTPQMYLFRTVILIAFLVILGCKSHHPTFPINNGIYVDQVTIVSANNNGIIDKYEGYILIENDTIRYCGKQEPKVIGTVKRISGKGKYIIPGLIDSHVHLANVAGMTWQNQKDYPALVNSYFTQLPKSFLYHGFTTLIDVNNYAPDVLERINNSPVKPDIFTCGKQIQVMNDFMMEMEESPLADRLQYPFLFDPYNKNIHIPDSINLELHSPKAIVTDIARNQQGIGVKIVYEDESSGFPQQWELPSLHLMRDVVEQARQVGIPVLMHATSFDGQQFGLEAGIDIFAHAMWNWYKNPEQFLDTAFTKEHQALLEKIADKRIGYQPTFRVIHGEIDLLADHFTADPALKHVYPKSYLDWLNTDEGRWGKQKILQRAKIVQAVNPTLYNIIRPKFENDQAMFRGIQEVFELRLNRVAKFLSARDAKLLLGTDGGAMNMATHPPGLNGFLEMQLWANAGIPLAKIFLAATFDNAKAFHLDNAYGTIEKGKIANLILLSQDPLQDIAAYNQIITVIVRGKDYPRNTLSANQQN